MSYQVLGGYSRILVGFSRSLEVLQDLVGVRGLRRNFEDYRGLCIFEFRCLTSILEDLVGS